MKTHLLFVVIFSLSTPGSSLHSSLWCSGSHGEDRACTFINLCYAPKHDEFIFFRDKERSVFSGLSDPQETKELLQIPPHATPLHLSMFNSKDADSLVSEVKFVEVTLIHIGRKHAALLPEVILPIWRSLHRIQFGDLDGRKVHGVAFKYDTSAKESSLLLTTEAILQQIFGHATINGFAPSNSTILTCYDKVHVGYLEERYPGEAFRNYILERLNVDNTMEMKSLIVILDFQKDSNPSHDILTSLCSDCDLIHCSLNDFVDTLYYLSSAKVIFCEHNCLSAGLMISRGSILIQRISEETEEPSADLLKVLKNRNDIQLRLWLPTESSSLSSDVLENQEYDERLWVYPSRITGFQCNLEIKDSELTVNFLWDPPLNSRYFSHLMTYELFILGITSKETNDEDMDFLDQFSVKKKSASLPVNAKAYSALKVYILATVPLDEGFESKGIDTDFICDLDQDIQFSSE